jgi:hypothetical protein
MNSQICTIQILHELTNFWSTVVKLYYTEETTPTTSQDDTLPEITVLIDHSEEGTITINHPVRQSCRHLKGFKNKQYLTALNSFLSTKEKEDLELLLKLWQNRIITDPGLSFQVSDKKKIEGLVARRVFVFKQFNTSKHSREQIFKLQIVHEVKSKTTSTLFEKSHLIIQAYNNLDKEIILTQSPTIQRASQRLIIALALIFIKLKIIL